MTNTTQEYIDTEKCTESERAAKALAGFGKEAKKAVAFRVKKKTGFCDELKGKTNSNENTENREER